MALNRTPIKNMLSRRSRREGSGATLPTRFQERRMKAWVICSCFVLCALGAGPVDDADEPPVANQPPSFNGAIGNFRDFTTHAAPTILPVGDPLTFTVRITGSARQPVPRPSLRRLPEFSRQFVIEDLPELEAKPGQGAWEFRYLLRPKPSNPPVKEIPALRFDYYKPGVVPREKGYRTKYARAIPLTVQARREVQSADVQGARRPVAYPEMLYELVEGPGAVLRHEERFALPDPLLLVLIFLGMPALCVAWYLWWRRAYPDAVRLTRRRQSQAARRALQELASVDCPDVDRMAEPVAAIVSGYLRCRWGLTAAEPTPQEVAAQLEQHGCPEPHARQLAAFYKRCDVERFAPRPDIPADDLAAAAGRLIQALEDQP